MTFQLTSVPASEADLDILNDILKTLSSPSAWDRADDRDCGNKSPGRVSLFCALQNAAIARMRWVLQEAARRARNSKGLLRCEERLAEVRHRQPLAAR